MVIYISVFQILVLSDEFLDFHFEAVFTYHHECRPDAWNYYEEYDGRHDGLGLMCFSAVLELELREVQVLHHRECSQDDEYAVYGEQIECSGEITEASDGETVSCGTERRHQRCSDGHS